MKKFLCWLLGHKNVTCHEFRYRKYRGLYQFGGYHICKRCGKKLTTWEPMWTGELPHHYMWATEEEVKEFMKHFDK